MPPDVILDQFDLDFVEALHKEWRQAPPLRVIVAAFAGYKPPEDKPQYMDADAAREFMRLTGGRIPGVGSI